MQNTLGLCNYVANSEEIKIKGVNNVGKIVGANKQDSQ
jgi:hypothetical protein